MTEVPGELKAALRNLRRVRAARPTSSAPLEEYAAWREEMGDALEGLSHVLIYEDDRERALAESRECKEEASAIRRQLGYPGPGS